MATFNKVKLSGSTAGKQIKVAATSTPGTTIHTAGSGTTNWDEVWIYVTNNHTAAVALTIEWGGTASPDDLIQMSIPSKTGLYLIIPGLILNDSSVIKAFAATTNVLNISGWVNRITA